MWIRTEYGQLINIDHCSMIYANITEEKHDEAGEAMQFITAYSASVDQGWHNLTRVRSAEQTDYIMKLVLDMMKIHTVRLIDVGAMVEIMESTKNKNQ